MIRCWRKAYEANFRHEHLPPFSIFPMSVGEDHDELYEPGMKHTCKPRVPSFVPCVTGLIDFDSGWLAIIDQDQGTLVRL